MNSSQSIKFGMTGGSFEDSMELSKSKSKPFSYKRSRIDKLINENIVKNRYKEEKATLKKIKEVEEQINKREELNRLNQQVRLKNVKKSKKSLNRKQNAETGEFMETMPETLQIKNSSKLSFQKPRAWQEFLEVRKEISNMNEKQFMSTDSGLNTKIPKFIKSGTCKDLLKKSGSVDGTFSPSIIQAFLNEAEGPHFWNDKKSKATSNKDLRSLNTTKVNPIPKSKSKGPKKTKKGDKICWDYIESKDNIRKYMKKKHKKLVKQELRDKLFDFKKKTKI